MLGYLKLNLVEFKEYAEEADEDDEDDEDGPGLADLYGGNFDVRAAFSCHLCCL